jgi:hypothetical protein
MLHYISLEWLAIDKPFSLSGPFVRYKENERVDNAAQICCFVFLKLVLYFQILLLMIAVTCF